MFVKKTCLHKVTENVTRSKSLCVFGAQQPTMRFCAWHVQVRSPELFTFLIESKSMQMCAVTPLCRALRKTFTEGA